jgi:hypothetical protein
MPRIHYCTVVYDRWDTFKLLAESFVQLAAQPGNEPDRLWVYDWNSGGKDIYSSWPDTIQFCGGGQIGHINRAAGRAMAMQCADPKLDELVFFVDCDMVLPSDFSERVRKWVKPGAAYFPVCYSLYRGAPMVVKSDGPPWSPGSGSANGWWRESGRGNCGFTAADVITVGGWDGARWGTGYGREDDDLFWRAMNKLRVHRERVPGFFHQWHPRVNEKQNPSTRKK